MAGIIVFSEHASKPWADQTEGATEHLSHKLNFTGNLPPNPNNPTEWQELWLLRKPAASTIEEAKDLLWCM